MDVALSNGYVSGTCSSGLTSFGFLLYCKDGKCYDLTDICGEWYCEQTGTTGLLCISARRKLEESAGYERKLEEMGGLRKMRNLKLMSRRVKGKHRGPPL